MDNKQASNFKFLFFQNAVLSRIPQLRNTPPYSFLSMEVEAPPLHILPRRGKYPSCCPLTNALPTSSSFQMTFSAMTRQDLFVGFFINDENLQKSFYEFRIGSHGNTEIELYRNGIQMYTQFHGRTVSESLWIEYWIHYTKEGVLSMGLGNVVGEMTLVSYSDEEPLDITYYNFTSWTMAIHIRNIILIENEKPIFIAPLSSMIWSSALSGHDLMTEEKRALYNQDCTTLKKRAAKFNNNNIQLPKLRDYLSSQQVRALQRSGAQPAGFTTGFDMSADAEQEKREARMKRFITPAFGTQNTTAAVRAKESGMSELEWQDEMEMEKKRTLRAVKFGMKPTSKKGSFALHMKSSVFRDRIDFDKSVQPRTDAVHVFSCDDAFTQVRSADIMRYFNGYGPSYVEWMNDSSCTVVFEDSYTASRALMACSEEVSSEVTFPQPGVPRPGKNSEQQNRKEMDASQEDVEEGVNVSENKWRYGLEMKGKNSHIRTWRVLLRPSTELDFPAERTFKRSNKRRSEISGRNGLMPSRKFRKDIIYEDMVLSSQEETTTDKNAVVLAKKSSSILDLLN